MTQRVTVAAFGMRRALLAMLAEEGREMANAADPVPFSGRTRPNTTQARTRAMRVAAVADLLDGIGWFAAAGQDAVFDVDLRRHAWATTRALELVISRQDGTARQARAPADAVDTPTAVRRLADARAALSAITNACRSAGIAIEDPHV